MLKDLVPETREIKVYNSSFHVRGLTLEDIGKLIGEYREPLGLLIGDKSKAGSLIEEYPQFIATVIAVASDEPDQVEAASRLPFAVQLEALEAIWTITIPDADALGKLIARIRDAIQE